MSDDQRQSVSRTLAMSTGIVFAVIAILELMPGGRVGVSWPFVVVGVPSLYAYMLKRRTR